METVGDKLAEKADQVLRGVFPGASLEWDPIEPNERISGWILWDGFRGVEPVDRQLAVSRALRAGLEPEEWKSIVAVFAVTPEEAAAMRSENQE